MLSRRRPVDHSLVVTLTLMRVEDVRNDDNFAAKSLVRSARQRKGYERNPRRPDGFQLLRCQFGGEGEDRGEEMESALWATGVRAQQCTPEFPTSRDRACLRTSYLSHG